MTSGSKRRELAPIGPRQAHGPVLAGEDPPAVGQGRYGLVQPDLAVLDRIDRALAVGGKNRMAECAFIDIAERLADPDRVAA